MGSHNRWQSVTTFLGDHPVAENFDTAPATSLGRLANVVGKTHVTLASASGAPASIHG